MAGEITWLHISDLHMHPKRTSWDADRVLEKLVEDLRELRQAHGLRPDLIFFTGDLAFGGSDIASQFDKGHEFLEAVRTAFDPPIPPENVFLVPGNHDVNRDAVAESETLWTDTVATADKVNENIHSANRQWGRFMERLQDYHQFLQRHGYRHLHGDASRLTYAEKREVSGYTVGIAGFNSAWTCCRNDEKGKLWLGARWQMATLEAALHGVDFKIALVHHPGGWLNEYEANEFWKKGIQRRFNVCLHGHEHDPWAEQTNANLTLSAGACYEGSTKRNGYNFVRLFPATSTGEVWFRKYDPSGVGGWGPEFIAGMTGPGGFAPLESLRWLKPKNPPDDSGPGGGLPGSPPSGGEPSIKLGPEDLASQADAIGKAVQAAIAQRSLPSTNQSEITQATATRVTRAVHQNAVDSLVVINVFVSAAPQVAADSTGPGAAAERLQPEFLKIDRLLERFRLDDGEAAIEAIATAHPDDLTPRERFRLGVKRGHLLYARRNTDGAVAAYRDAAGYVDPADTHGRYFRALASELGGKLGEAHEMGTALRRDHPDFEPAGVVSLCVRTAPKEQTAAALREQFGGELCDSPEVAYTLARRAADEGSFDEGVRYAELAVAGKQGWTDAKSTLAAILLERQFGKTVTAGHSRPPVPEWKDFSRVFSLLTSTVVDVEQGGQSPDHAAQLRQNLAVALTAVGRADEALDEYRKAFALHPAEPEIVYRYAMTLAKSGQAPEAIKIVREWLKTHQAVEITLLLAQLLGRRLAPESEANENLDEAIALVASQEPAVESLDAELQADWTALYVQFLVDAGRPQDARDVLARTPKERLEPPLFHLLTAEVEESDNRRDDARAAALRAADALKDDTHPVTVRQTAIALEELELYSRAAETWRRVSTMTVLGLEERHVISCLDSAKDREGLIAACCELRRNGVLEPVLINAELAALERISYERLVVALEELIAAPVTEKLRKELRAQLAYVGLFIDRPALVEADVNKLPRVAEVENARAGRMVVEVLRRGDKPLDAVRYAYELFRRFPDQPDAYLAVIFSTGISDGTMPSDWPEPEHIKPGVAARYRENDTGEEMWCVVEDASNPNPLLNERSPGDPVSRAMDGKTVGSTFVLRATPTPQRDATVIAVVSKYTYRLNDCLANFERRFPEHQDLIWSIHAGEDGKQGVETLLRQVDERVEHQRQIDELFRTEHVTLALYAKATGRTIFEAINKVAASPSLKLKQCLGMANEFASALRAHASAKAYVVDATAVGTLWILSYTKSVDVERALTALDSELIVSELVLADVRQVLASYSSRGGMSITKEGDRYVRHVVEAADAQREHQRLKDFVEMLRRRCVVAPAEAPSPAAAEAYEQLAKAIGRSGAESVRLAGNRPDAVLWTDELYTAQLGYPDVGDRRVWTKLLIDRLALKGKVPAEAASATAITIFTAGYAFTGLNPDSLFLAAQRCEWRPYAEPLRSMLAQYQERRITVGSAVGSASGFLSRVWTHRRTRKHQEQARAISIRLLQEVLKRSDGGYVAALIREHIQRLLRRHGLTKAWRSAYRYAVNHRELKPPKAG